MKNREPKSTWAYLAPVLHSSRDWHRREQGRYDLHHIVMRALDAQAPKNWHQVILEWPHKSKDDKRLAFTQNTRHGNDDRQVVTTLGKYLRRHWPDLSDHAIRDMVALDTVDEFEILSDMQAIIKAVKSGPVTCMRDLGVGGRHPYEVYDPKYGWRLAIRRDKDGDVAGRALLKLNPGSLEETGYYVRSFKVCLGENGDVLYSNADEALEAWLKSHGHEHKRYWDEEQLAAIWMPTGELLMPYIDGDHQCVEVEDDQVWVRYRGRYKCENQDGTCKDTEEDGDEDLSYCEDCQESEPTEDGTWVGRVGYTRWICSGCLDNHYDLARGRDRENYYVHHDDVVRVGDERYHKDFLSDNDIIQLEDGDYAERDDAFYCPIRTEFYLLNKGVETSDFSGLVHEDETWVCDVSGRTWSTQGDPVHPEDMPDEDVHPDATWVCKATGLTWSERIEPILNGQGYKFHPDEMSDCAAVTDGQQLLVETV